MSTSMDISPISYTNKDFRAVYEELLNLVDDLTERWDPKSTNESDPGLVLLKLKAFIADKLNYNLDKNVLENFPSQVTQRGNAQKIYDLLGYSMGYYKSATTTVSMKYVQGDNTQGIAPGSYKIPEFTQITDDSNSVNYVTLQPAMIHVTSGMKPVVEVDVMEGVIQEFAINGNTVINVDNLDSDYRLYFTETMVAQNGIFITNVDDATVWEAVSNLESTQLQQKVFKFGVLPTSNTCYLEFPQDAATLFGNGIKIKYIITSGVGGNIGANVLTSLSNDLEENLYVTEDNGETISNSTVNVNLRKYTLITQPQGASNGQDPESLKSAYRNCQKTINTFNTLVTTKDYENAIFNSGEVSNVVVSDRTNDINYSYKVVNKYSDGERDIFLNTSSTPNIYDMNAFNIAIYALNPSSYVNDATTFNGTFQTSSSTLEDAQTVVENYKSIQHNYINTVNEDDVKTFMFKNLVSLEGKVLTYQKVTNPEAEEIQSNINIALYQNYNARKVDFGQELNYESLINTIVNSDERIKDVVLEYPKYELYEMKSNNKYKDTPINSYDITSSINNNLTEREIDILAKSVLAGVTPYCIFDNSMVMDYSMTPTEGYVIEDVTDETITIGGTECKIEEVISSNGVINLKPPSSSSGGSGDGSSGEGENEGTEGEGSGSTDGSTPTSPSPSLLTASQSSHKNIAAITTSTIIKSGDTLDEYENVFCVGPSYVPKVQLSTCLYYTFLCNGEGTVVGTTTNYYIKKKYRLYGKRDSTTGKMKYIHVQVPFEGSYPFNGDDYDDVDAINAVNAEIEGYENDNFERQIVENHKYALSNGGTIYTITTDDNGYFEIATEGKEEYDAIVETDFVKKEKKKEDVVEPPTLKANSYYALGEDQYLLVAEGAKNKCLQLQDSGKKYYCYTKGSIVCPTIDIKSIPYSYSNLNSILKATDIKATGNLGTSDQIEILEENKFQINKTGTIYAVWAFDNLYNQLFADNKYETYTKDGKHGRRILLQNNDVFIYTNSDKQELMLLGSGTEISIESTSKENLNKLFENAYKDKFWSIPSPSINAINSMGLNAPIEWNEIPTDIEFYVAEKQIISLGAGTTIEFNGNLQSITNEMQEIDGDFSYTYEGETTTNKLPAIYNIDGNTPNWKVFSRLQLVSSPSKGQTLNSSHNQAVALYALEQDEKGNDKYKVQSILTSPQHINTNTIVALSGGAMQNSLTVTSEGEFENNLSVSSTTKTKSISNNIENSFTSDSGIKKENIHISEYDDYTQISINVDSSEGLAGEFNLSLSPHFANTLIPILFVSSNNTSDSKAILSVGASRKIIDNGGNIVEDTTDATIEDMATGDTNTSEDIFEIFNNSNKYLNYYKILDNGEENIVEFNLKLSLSNLTSNVQIILYTPLKIERESSFLDWAYKNDNKITVKSQIRSLAKFTDKDNSEQNLFDYSHQIDSEDIIENPLDAESFFRSNHIYNKYIIPQLDTGRDKDTNIPKINIKVSKKSLQSNLKDI